MKIKSTYHYFIKAIISVIVLISSLAATYTYSPYNNFRQLTQTELVVSTPKTTYSKNVYQFINNRSSVVNNPLFPYLFENALRYFEQQTRTQFKQAKSDFTIMPIYFQQIKLFPQNEDITMVTGNI